MQYFKIILVCFFVSTLTACTSMQAVNVDNVNAYKELAQHVKVGDELLIVTKNGQEHQLVVKEITSESIVSDAVTIQITDINKLEKRKFSLLKTGGTTLLIWGGLFLFAFGPFIF